MKYTTIINNEQFEIEVQRDGSLLVNGKRYEVDFLPLEGSLFSLITETESLQAAVEAEGTAYEVLIEGRMYEGQVLDERAMLLINRKGGLVLDSGDVLSPMPGLVVDVLVSEGEEVTAGQTVVILESMKMQNELKSPRDGTVTTVKVAPQQTVDKNELLVVVGGGEDGE